MEDELKEDKRCILCGENALALVGLLMGAVFIYMSVDILTGGRVSNVISGQVIDNDSTIDALTGS